MLAGRTALIVEKEFLIALDIQRMLESFGVGQTLFARTVAEAEQLRERWPEIAIAVVEVRSSDAPTLQLAGSLAAARIPTVLTTSDIDFQHGLAPQANIPVIVKPVPEDAMALAVRQALDIRALE